MLVQVLLRSARLKEVYDTIKTKSFSSFNKTNCWLVYKGVELEPWRTVNDYCDSEKVPNLAAEKDVTLLLVVTVVLSG